MPCSASSSALSRYPTSHTLFINDMQLGLWQRAFERKESVALPKDAWPMAGTALLHSLGE